MHVYICMSASGNNAYLVFVIVNVTLIVTLTLTVTVTVTVIVALCEYFSPSYCLLVICLPVAQSISAIPIGMSSFVLQFDFLS
jgi:hypothetical protein